MYRLLFIYLQRFTGFYIVEMTELGYKVPD